jgi:hypothetical protein
VEIPIGVFLNPFPAQLLWQIVAIVNNVTIRDVFFSLAKTVVIVLLIDSRNCRATCRRSRSRAYDGTYRATSETANYRTTNPTNGSAFCGIVRIVAVNSMIWIGFIVEIGIYYRGIFSCILICHVF